MFIYIWLLTESANAGIDLPALEIRINLLLIAGFMILGLILLLTLKIYQLESIGKGEKKR